MKLQMTVDWLLARLSNPLSIRDDAGTDDQELNTQQVGIWYIGD